LFKPNRYYENDEHSNIKNDTEKPNMDYSIKHPKIRVIDDNGDNLGIFTVKEGISKAKDKNLNLIEINPTANPPVCKIMDLGKYIFEIKKHKKETAQKPPEHKEIRLTPSISQHDMEIKAKKTEEFLKGGSKVTIQFKLKGRENKKYEIIKSVAERFYDLLKTVCTMAHNGESYVLTPNFNKNI
jgi:translation initiation factor IF-3